MKFKVRIWANDQMTSWEQLADDDECISLYNILNGEYEHAVVMLYTTSNDRNGKEVYAGDIIEWKRGGGVIFVVVWSEKDCAFSLLRHLPKGTCTYCNRETLKDCEVLGNIYENPKLIKLLGKSK